MSLATGEGEGKNPRQGRINDEERTLSLITPSVRTGGLFASLLFCLQNLPPAAFASAKVPAGGSTGALVRNDRGDGGLHRRGRGSSPPVGRTWAQGRRAIRESPLRGTGDADCHTKPLRHRRPHRPSVRTGAHPRPPEGEARHAGDTSPFRGGKAHWLAMTNGGETDCHAEPLPSAAGVTRR